MSRRTIHVESVAIDALTLGETVERIAKFVEDRATARHVCTCNLDHLVWIARDSEFAAAYAAADLVVADGAPVVWLSRIAARAPGDGLPERVAGVDLFWALVRLSHERGTRLFFLGGSPGAADTARVRVVERWPNANVCGVYCPPREAFDTPEEQRRIRDAVHSAAPDILFVAFGAPKQEKWIHANKAELRVPVSIGVGGTYEFASGAVRRAPRWVQRAGLEWAFRFSQEPRRLFSRYFVDDVPYLARALTRAIRARRRA